MFEKILNKLKQPRKKKVNLDTLTETFIDLLHTMNDSELISFIDENVIPDSVLIHKIKYYILYRRYSTLIYIIKRIGIGKIPDLDELFHESCYYGAYDVVDHLMTYDEVLKLDSLMSSARMANFCSYPEITKLIELKYCNYMRGLKINKLLYEKETK